MISASLSGKRIAITGSTGFLGTALVERLLRCVPDCELVLIVRPGRRGARRRVERDILRNDAFDRLRSELGDDFDEQLGARIQAIAGDVGSDGIGLDSDGRALLASCDIVIHSAATVSFDSPLDQAVEVNLLGPVRVARTLNELGVSPHLVAVSTCYVAGSRRGNAPELPIADSPFFVGVDWPEEVDAARRARHESEDRSRRPDQLDEFRSQARRELGAAGTPALADRTETLRTRWVDDTMAEAGRSRARSLGFPDAYAYTKALGEGALLSEAGDLPVSIVRPSIIESALVEPSPGWIRGFRMAEPVILSYARGLLSEFPGVPEGIVDVIPVDHVVAAICAVAARGPHIDEDSGGADIVQVASGSVNPLRYGRLVDLAQEWFSKNPLYDEHGQPIGVPEWRFPGRGRVQRQLVQGKAMVSYSEKILHALPLRGRQTELAIKLEDTKEQLERAGGYVELYGAYAECEAIYGIDRLLSLWESLDDDDRDSFAFDPRVIDWKRYTHDNHLPSVVKAGRARTTPNKGRATSRSARLRKQVLAPERQLAAFDLENTLIASNVVASFAWLATRRLGRLERARFALKTLLEAPAMMATDRRDRSDFLRSFYRRYEHAPVEQLEADAAELFSDLLLTKSFPDAIRRVRAHRAAGHRTVLITGALDVVVGPMTPLFDDVICASLGTVTSRSGRRTFDGRINGVAPIGEARYQSLVDYATQNDLDLRESVAYADSSSDLPMLEAVGFPVAVNPETKLASIARRRGWLVENFAKSPGGPRRTVPIGPLTRSGIR